jgi:hypothetical protein
MAKASRDKPTKVEVQKGPIRMEEQFTQGFTGRPQCIMEDIDKADLRRSGQTLTLHEPKR